MSRRRLIWVTILCILIAPIAAGLNYVLPSHDVLRIVGTEVRRIDLDGKPGGDTRDVYYFYAEDVESKKPRVFRNEDTGWGFPPYFKFNAADVQAVGASIAAERGVAVVTSYGWRIQLISLFPNAIALRRASADASVFPWFNVIFLTLLASLCLAIFLWVRRLTHPQAAPRAS